MKLLQLFFIPTEVFLFFYFTATFGFFKTLLAYWAPSLIGLLLLSSQSRNSIIHLQTQIRAGKSPGLQMMKTVTRFAGALFLTLPFLSTRLLAIPLLLPGIDYLVILTLQTWFLKKLSQGNFTFGTPGNPGFPGNPGTPGQGPQGVFFRFGSFGNAGPHTNPFQQDDLVDVTPREEKEARVIDVSPIPLPHVPKKE